MLSNEALLHSFLMLGVYLSNQQLALAKGYIVNPTIKY